MAAACFSECYLGMLGKLGLQKREKYRSEDTRCASKGNRWRLVLLAVLVLGFSQYVTVCYVAAAVFRCSCRTKHDPVNLHQTLGD